MWGNCNTHTMLVIKNVHDSGTIKLVSSFLNNKETSKGKYYMALVSISGHLPEGL